MKFQNLNFCFLILLIPFLIITPVDAGLGKYIGRNIGKQLGKKVMKDVRHDRNKIKKEVCKLFKELIIRRRFIRQDLELLRDFINERLPSKWKPDREYENLTEEVGYKLIDPALTYNDYSYLRDLLNKIWNTRSSHDIWSQIRSFRIGVFPIPNIAL